MKKCTNCNCEIVDESIFCPYCGSKQESKGKKEKQKHKKQQKDGKKNKRIIIILIALVAIAVIGLLVYNYIKRIEKFQTFEEQITNDYFLEADGIEGKIKENISYSVVDVENDQIAVKVEYVDISEGLKEYVETASDFSEENLLIEIERLLNESEKVTEEYTLSYETLDEVIGISYTPEINDAFTCGLTKFYRNNMEEMLEEK